MNDPGGCVASVPFIAHKMRGTMSAASDSYALIDPVCGMEVDVDSPHRTAYGGALFCFCSAGCLDLFVANPSEYVVLFRVKVDALPDARPSMTDQPDLKPRAATLPTVPLPTLPVWLGQNGEATMAAGPGTLPIGLPGSSWREFLGGLFPWRERRFARNISRELLKLYWIVSASHPGLRGRDLYRKIIIARTRVDPASAESLLDQAEESFAAWPTRRALRFSDVVHFVAVSEYLASHGNSPWVHANMGREVASLIPDKL